jgi:hypothetical protein
LRERKGREGRKEGVNGREREKWKEEKKKGGTGKRKWKRIGKQRVNKGEWKGVR